MSFTYALCEPVCIFGQSSNWRSDARYCSGSTTACHQSLLERRRLMCCLSVFIFGAEITCSTTLYPVPSMSTHTSPERRAQCRSPPALYEKLDVRAFPVCVQPFGLGCRFYAYSRVGSKAALSPNEWSRALSPTALP